MVMALLNGPKACHRTFAAAAQGGGIIGRPGECWGPGV
jgi:hypothetical protein